MFITIYQINLDRGKSGAAFLSYELVCRHLGAPDASLYDPVFSGEVDCKDLEDVYSKFNLECPEGYKGRSMSVSDIVKIFDKNGNPTFHFCDSIGFKQIEIEPPAITQEDIDAVLTRGSCFDAGKHRIYEQYMKQEPKENNIAFLKKEYGVGGLYPAIPDRGIDECYDAKGIKIIKNSSLQLRTEVDLSWSKVEKRISELISAGLYL